jgi:hypothetical protein
MQQRGSMASKDSRGRTELVTSSTTVDIVSIPWHFHAVKYDQLDQLFLPLLASAQQANDILGVRTGGAESALNAAAHLAGELMRDASFTPVRTLSVNAANAYLIDFGENSFQVETSVNARDERRASLFRVKVTGAIRGDKFIVADPVTKSSLFSFTRFEANKPDFFSSEFPFIAHESRNNPAMFAGDNSAMVQGVVDLVLGVPIGGETITVRVHKQSDTLSVEVKNPITNETVMSLPLAALGNITKLVEGIAQHLTTNAKARLAMGHGSVAPAPRIEVISGENKGTAEAISEEAPAAKSST